MVDVKLIQKRLLEMAVVIRDILEKENIPYLITYGTLLGAVRHKGFIPWDDDFDMFLFDDSYEKAIELIRKNLPNNLFLEDSKTEPLYFHGWAHIKDLNSEAFCEQYKQDNLYSHHGISLDLYRLKRISANEVIVYRINQKLEYLNRKKIHDLISDEEYNKITKTLKKDLEEEERKINKKSMKEAVWTFIFEDVLTDTDLFPLKRYEFENQLFYGPNNAESQLKQCYGDYLKLPNEADRKPHYSMVNFY